MWGAQRANPVYAARYRHLTTREENRRKAAQAQTVIAAAILRQLHAVVPTGRAWDPNIAATAPESRRWLLHKRTRVSIEHSASLSWVGASPPRH